MKIAVVCRSGTDGGAAITSRRLTEALREAGADASLVTADDHPLLKPLPFLAERLQAAAALLRNSPARPEEVLRNLWKIDTGAFGLPLWQDKAIKEADAVIFNWLNQGTLSLDGIRRAAKGKKAVWTMHDMWPMTGICHHSMDCRRFEQECGRCPLLGAGGDRQGRDGDLSHKVWKKKTRLYDGLCGEGPDGNGMTFVAVSGWLRDRAGKSSLLKDRRTAVIPNPFKPVQTEQRREGRPKVLFAAAALDNWIKGLDTFREAVRRLGPETEVWLMGGLRNPGELEKFDRPVKYLGTVNGEKETAEVYAQCDAVVNCSLFENLPGTLVEGQAYGAVPVAFDRGGQRDIIDHLDTGYLAPWSDSPEERAAAIAEGTEWALRHSRDGITAARMREEVERKFSYGTVAAQYLQLLEQQDNERT